MGAPYTYDRSAMKKAPRIPEVVAIVGKISLILGLVVLLIGLGIRLIDEPSGKAGAPEANRKTGISAPLTSEQVKSYARRQGLQRFYWLGPPEEDEDLRVDTRTAKGQLALAYTDSELRDSYESGQEVSYINLLNTSILPPNSMGPLRSFEKKLREEAKSIQPYDDFTAYVLLPPFATEIGADIVMIDKRRKYIARLVYGHDELNAEQRKDDLAALATRIAVVSLPNG